MNSGSDRIPVPVPSPFSSDIAASVCSCALPTTTRKFLLISFTASSVSLITSSTDSVTASSFLRLACEALSQRSSIVSRPTTTCWKSLVRLRYLRIDSSSIASSSAFTSRTTSASATRAASGASASEIMSAHGGTRKDIHAHGRNRTTTSAASR